MSNPFKSYRDASRTNYGHTADTPTTRPAFDNEAINVGSLQRIADAVEKIAQNYDALLSAKKSAEDTRDYWRNKAEQRRRSNISLRGYITRIKRRGPVNK